MSNIRSQDILAQKSAVAAYIYLKTHSNIVDHEHLILLLFFADKEHLNMYARSITGGLWTTSANGPSLPLDVGPAVVVDYGYLSISDEEVMDDIIKKHGHHNVSELTAMFYAVMPKARVGEPLTSSCFFEDENDPVLEQVRELEALEKAFGRF